MILGRTVVEIGEEIEGVAEGFLHCCLRAKKQQQREEKLEELRTAAPTISVTSEAKAVGKAEVEHMDVDVKSPGNNIARIINIGDNKDED